MIQPIEKSGGYHFLGILFRLSLDINEKNLREVIFQRSWCGPCILQQQGRVFMTDIMKKSSLLREQPCCPM